MTLGRLVPASIWIVSLFLVATYPVRGSETAAPTDQVLTVIQNCIAAPASPWPQSWREEYVDTVGEALKIEMEPVEFRQRLDILTRGFKPYWEQIKTDRNRAMFDFQCARIRWYTEQLMAPDFPSPEDRDPLSRQWRTLWSDAGDALLSQFPFLDPNIVRQAESDHLNKCLQRIDAPLEPLFQHPLTAQQVDRIKDGWHELRYARVDLMRQLGGEAVFFETQSAHTTSTEHPHYLLAQRSLKQLESHMWTVVITPPDHFLKAFREYQNAERRRRQRTHVARAQEQRLVVERSKRLHEAEYLSFLLAVVLESPKHFESLSANGVAEASAQRIEETPPKEVVPMR